MFFVQCLRSTRRMPGSVHGSESSDYAALGSAAYFSVCEAPAHAGQCSGVRF